MHDFVSGSVRDLLLWHAATSLSIYAITRSNQDTPMLRGNVHLNFPAKTESQLNFKNRSAKLPVENMWDSKMFIQFLRDQGHGDKWNNLIYPTMKKCLISKSEALT